MQRLKNILIGYANARRDYCRRHVRVQHMEQIQDGQTKIRESRSLLKVIGLIFTQKRIFVRRRLVN